MSFMPSSKIALSVKYVTLESDSEIHRRKKIL